MLSKGTPPGAQQYTEEELRVAVDEAARWGRHVAAHAHGTDGIKAAIRAGIHTIDHGSMLDDEAVALMRTPSRVLRADAVHQRIDRGESQRAGVGEGAVAGRSRR